MITIIDSGEEFPLSSAQDIVGGMVEIANYNLQLYGTTFQVLVDEEGLLKKKPLNELASLICLQSLVGDVLLLGGTARWT